MLLVALLSMALISGQAPNPASVTNAPPGQRLLQGEDLKQATALEAQVENALAAGKWVEAHHAAVRVRDLRIARQGKEHWEAVSADWNVRSAAKLLTATKPQLQAFAECLPIPKQVAALEAKTRNEEALKLREKYLRVLLDIFGADNPATTDCYNNVAISQKLLGRYQDAEAGFLQALAINRRILGEEHPATAHSHDNLGGIQYDLRKHQESDASHRTALAIRLKVLGEEHAATAETYNNLGANLIGLGRFQEAEELFLKALAIKRKTVGEEHHSTADCYCNLAIAQNSLGKFAPAEENNRKSLALRLKVLGDEHPDTALSHHCLAAFLDTRGRFQEAEKGHRQALAIRLKVLGEMHPNTAYSYNNVGLNHYYQGRHQQADETYRRALAIRFKLTGEETNDVAQLYGNMAVNTNAQGKFREAEEFASKALAIRRKVLGDDHPSTARSYSNLAGIQSNLGKFQQAEELHRKALAILRKRLGDDHYDLIPSYGNLAFVHQAQGKYQFAEEGYRKALALGRKAHGENSFQTATAYSGIALAQKSQRNLADAEIALRKALDIRRKLYGEDHSQTASAYHNLAANQHELGKYDEAQQGFAKALAIFRKSSGEEHAETATCYTNLAHLHHEMDHLAEAESGFRKALAIRKKALGEFTLQTADSYSDVAAILQTRGDYQGAEEFAGKAAHVFARARLQVASTGLERTSVTAKTSPLYLLASALAHNGKPVPAWERFEQSLGQGIGDDFAARLARPAAQRDQQTVLQVRLRQLERELQKLAAVKAPTSEQLKRREQILAEQMKQLDALAALSSDLEAKYGPVAGRSLDIATLQRALPADGAFLGWLDQAKEHWAVLLAAKGDPVWVRLSGGGPDGAWTKDDDKLPAMLREALLSVAPWQSFARRLHAQRLAPLAGNMSGIKHLIVLPCEAMDGVPLEVIADGFVISYAPSASLFAALTQQKAPSTSGLLALGDATFRGSSEGELPLPPGGILLSAVTPGSAGATAGLHSGDVMLRYGDAPMNSSADLKKAADAASKPTEVLIWRLEPSSNKAKELALQVPAGRLGVMVATEPGPQALASQRQTGRLLAARDASSWQPLPGTRYEVKALERLFADTKPTVLLGSDASEARLASLSADGTLQRARYVHLATHGEARSDKPFASRIILSRDHLQEGQRGELSADQVLQDWKLDAELVTLSACQTALGKYERGEGFVGFAQALLLAGSRSVCLSRWSVNDLSTALLMERFYQNLLGKRAGLSAPLGKATAFAEAKHWLRTLPREEAMKRAEAIGAGVERGPGARELQRLNPSKAQNNEFPYAHPFYWAGFVLVGGRS